MTTRYLTTKRMLGVALAIIAISFTLWMGSSTGDVTASTSPPVDEAAIKTCLDEMGATVVTDEFGNVGSDKSSSAVDECLALGHDTSANTLAATSELVELSVAEEAAAFDTNADTFHACMEIAGYELDIADDGRSYAVDDELYDDPKYLAVERECDLDAQEAEMDLRAELAE